MKHLITFFALCLIAALVVVTAGCDDDDDVLDDIIDESGSNDNRSGNPGHEVMASEQIH